MKRVLSIVLLSALLVGISAAPGGAKKLGIPDEPVAMTGVATYGAIAARTGDWAGDPGFLPGWDQLMDPAFNRCDIIEATLDMDGGRRGTLTTVEQCLSAVKIEAPRPPVVWDVQMSASGNLKATPRLDGPDIRPLMTGCDMNGTYPVYHGSFDGSHLYAATEFHGICDGGLFWDDVGGISFETGPIHATFELMLDAFED